MEEATDTTRNEQTEGSTKPTRTNRAVSCFRCRNRKVRCVEGSGENGTTTCARCEKTGLACIYDEKRVNRLQKRRKNGEMFSNYLSKKTTGNIDIASKGYSIERVPPGSSSISGTAPTVSGVAHEEFEADTINFDTAFMDPDHPDYEPDFAEMVGSFEVSEDPNDDRCNNCKASSPDTRCTVKYVGQSICDRCSEQWINNCNSEESMYLAKLKKQQSVSAGVGP